MDGMIHVLRGSCTQYYMNINMSKTYVGTQNKALLIMRYTPYLLSLGPHQANLVLIAYASSEGSGEPAHPRCLARTSVARSYKQ